MNDTVSKTDLSILKISNQEAKERTSEIKSNKQTTPQIKLKNA